jgi:hypothetical protein
LHVGGFVDLNCRLTVRSKVMRFWRALRKFNTASFAILSLLLIAVAALSAFELAASTFGFGRYATDGDGSDQASSDPDGVAGQVIDFGGRSITVYARGDMNDQFMRKVRIVDMRNGDTVKLSDDDQQKVYGGEAVGLPDNLNNNGYGYFAKLEQGTDSGKALFDLVFVRFSDFKTFKFASGVVAADALTELDSKSFSLVIWDKGDKGRFVIFDSAVGAITATRDLDLDRQTAADRDQSAGALAPANKFHFGDKE